MSATTDKLKRIIWRLQEMPGYPEMELKQIRKAIMFEKGTDERTIDKAINDLKELGWLHRLNRWDFKVTMDT